MRRSRLQPYLTGLNRGLKVIRYSNRGEHVLHGGNDVVYLYNRMVGVVPVGPIYLHGNNDYKGIKYRNRSLRGLWAKMRAENVKFREGNATHYHW